MNCAGPCDYHSLSFTRVQFNSPQVTPHTNPGDSYFFGRRWHNSYQSGIVSITLELVFHYREKFRGEQEEQQWTQNTSMRHPRHHVNKFATTNIHHDILRPIREKLCQDRQQWTSNSHREEHEENPLMVDPVKTRTEIDLNHSSLLPHLQSTLLGVCHTQKGITSAKIFPISELGGWKHTSAFHKTHKMNWRQKLKYLRQCRCSENWSVIGDYWPMRRKVVPLELRWH